MTDTFTARTAAVALALAGLGAIAAIAILAVQGKAVPSVLPEIALAAFGILAPSPVVKSPTPSVTVNQPALPAVVHVHPDDLAKIRAVPAPKKRGQQGEVGCLGGVLLGLFLLVLALIIWAAVR